MTQKGITVDHRLKTTNKRVYAIGDVAGGPQFTHVANYHAGLVIRHALFRLPVRADYSAIPHVDLYRSGTGAGGPDRSRSPCRAIRMRRRARAEFAENDRAVDGPQGARLRQTGAGPARPHSGRDHRRARMRAS